jgi:hypothetical protein
MDAGFCVKTIGTVFITRRKQKKQLHSREPSLLLIRRFFIKLTDAVAYTINNNQPSSFKGFLINFPKKFFS